MANKTLWDFIKKPGRLFLTLGNRELLNWISDERYLRIAYRIEMGKKLCLKPPVTFSEKLQWLKLYDRKPEYADWVDKYQAKIKAAALIGKKYIIPTLGVWDHFDDIDFNKLPEQFVLKCTHNSGGLIVVKDKNKLNKAHAKRRIEPYLKRNYYWTGREWPYKNVKPRIIAETYMEDSATHDLRDYKFFSFDGNVEALFIASERYNSAETKFDFFDRNFNHLPFTNGHPNAESVPPKPFCFDEMVRLSEILSKGIPQVRVDLYEVDGKVYFGEMTFFHWGGFVPFVPEAWDYKFGEWITLPQEPHVD